VNTRAPNRLRGANSLFPSLSALVPTLRLVRRQGIRDGTRVGARVTSRYDPKGNRIVTAVDSPSSFLFLSILVGPYGTFSFLPSLRS
jgi:hypothetical protein